MNEHQLVILEGGGEGESENKNSATDRDSEGILEHMSYKIRRSPLDLTNHTQKIRMLFEMGVPDRLYAAVLDLFLALKTNGRNLRYRMLAGAKSKLKDEHYRSLISILESENPDLEGLPTTPFSMLSAGVEGATTLVHTLDESGEKGRDPLTEAREYIEYSQIDEARCILESAILKNPGWEELHSELLEIYRSTRDVENFKNIMNRIAFIPKPSVDVWKQTAAFFFKG